MKFGHKSKVGHENGAVAGGDRIKKEVFLIIACLYADGSDSIGREIADRNKEGRLGGAKSSKAKMAGI